MNHSTQCPDILYADRETMTGTTDDGRYCEWGEDRRWYEYPSLKTIWPRRIVWEQNPARNVKGVGCNSAEDVA